MPGLITAAPWRNYKRVFYACSPIQRAGTIYLIARKLLERRSRGYGEEMVKVAHVMAPPGRHFGNLEDLVLLMESKGVKNRSSVEKLDFTL